MATKLDQSLDAIIGDRGTSQRGRGRGGARRTRARAAPVGGVRKAATAAKGAIAKAAGKVTGKTTNKSEPAPSGGATKVIVSGLPTDVNETQIKEYFQQVAGPVHRVWLTYGANGSSRGIATIQFTNATGGAKAMEQQGTKVDNRTLRVEAVVTSAGGATGPKSLRERATAPNSQPKKAIAAPAAQKTNTRGAKTAAATKATGARGAATSTRGRARGRNAGRPKKKTAEELDAEMTDYFGANGEPLPAGGAAAPGVAAPAAGAPAAAVPAGDDLGMDEIS